MGGGGAAVSAIVDYPRGAIVGPGRVVRYERPRFVPMSFADCKLWLNTARGVTTVDAAVTDPNDLSAAGWARTNIGAINATTYSDDGTNGAHQLYQNIPNLGLNHEAAFRIDIPLVGGAGRYVMLFVSAGTHYVAVDTTGAGSIVGTNIVPAPTYAGGVLEFVHTITNGGMFYRTSPDGLTHVYAGTGRTVTVGPGTAGHDAIEVTQRNASNWADLSGQGNDFGQATGADRVGYYDNQYNGHPALRSGDNTDHLEHATSVSLGTAATIFLAHKQGTTANNYVTCDASGANGIISRFNPGLLEWFNGGGADRYTLAASPAGLNIYTIRQTNAVALQAWRNGASVFGPVVPAAALANIKSFFARFSATNGSAAEDITEVVIYRRSLSDHERVRVERMMGAHWGVAVL